MLVAVKADAYGHGTLPVARAVVAAGAHGVAVATAEEAVTLRDAGFRRAASSSWARSTASTSTRRWPGSDVDFAVVSDHMAAVLPSLRGSGLQARVHLKIDSGMNRQGLFPAEVDSFLESHQRHPRDRAGGRDDPLRLRHAKIRPRSISSSRGSCRPLSGCAGSGRTRSPTRPIAPPPSTRLTRTSTWYAAAARSTDSIALAGGRPGRRTAPGTRLEVAGRAGQAGGHR